MTDIRAVADDVLGQLARKQNDLFRRVQEGSIEPGRVFEGLQLLQDGFSVVKAGPSDKPVVDFRLKEMDKFYRKVFKRSHELFHLTLKEHPEGYLWHLPIANWMTYDIAENTFERLGIPLHKYTNERLSKVIDFRKEIRDPSNGGYIIALRPCSEADEENKNLSADRCHELGIFGMTLLERMMLELWYFWRTKKHLDIDNWTLCSGSRYLDGNVPSVFFRDDKVHVGWYDSDCPYDNFRVRSAELLSA